MIIVKEEMRVTLRHFEPSGHTTESSKRVKANNLNPIRRNRNQLKSYQVMYLPTQEYLVEARLNPGKPAKIAIQPPKATERSRIS